MADNYRGQASSFPDGFNNVTIRGVPLVQSHTGQIYWVSNSTTLLPGQLTGSDGNSGTFNEPFGTIDYAVGRCTANRGDVIFVKPGHAETISTNAIILLDVAGLAIIGLGTGSLRPTLTYSVTTTTSNILVSANNISISNILFLSTAVAVGVCFTCATATTAKNFTVEGCEFRDTSTTGGSFRQIVTAVDANSMDGLYFARNSVFGIKASTVTAATTAVVMQAAMDRQSYIGNFIVHHVLLNAATLVAFGANSNTNVNMGGNRVFRPSTDVSVGSLFSGGSTASSGYVYDNYSWHIDSAGNNGLLGPTSTKLGFQNNYCHITSAGAGDASGIINPAAV